MALPSLVQSSDEVVVVVGTSGTTPAFTPAAGNLLALLLSQTFTSNRNYTVADDQGNTWTDGTVRAQGGDNVTSELEYANNVAGALTEVTVTVTLGQSSTFRFKVLEIADADDSAPLDQTSTLIEGSNVNNHTSAADGTVIDTADNVFVIVVGTLNANGTTVGADSGYTDLNCGDTTRCLWQYTTSATALANEQGPWTSVTARQGRSLIASFKGTAGGGGGSRRPRGMMLRGCQ